MEEVDESTSENNIIVDGKKTFQLRPMMVIKGVTFLEWKRGVKTDIHPD